MHIVRDAAKEVIDATIVVNGGRPIRKAADLQRALGIPTTLAWQVYRVAHAENLLGEVENVPGLKAVRRLIRAGEEKGLRLDALARLERTVKQFEHLVREHAGNRRAFNSIVAGLAGAPDGEVELQHRRLAFQANSHIWGTQVGTRLVTLIAHPSDSSSSGAHNLLDVLTLMGTVDLCRLRGHAPYELSSSALADGSPLRNADRIVALGHPLASNDVTTPGSTILTDFSSPQFPKISNYVDEDGRLVVELDPDDVGRQHAVTAFIAEMYRAAAGSFRSRDELEFSSTGDVRSPIARWIVDLVIADGAFGEAPPQPRAYMVMNDMRGTYVQLTGIEQRYERKLIEKPPVIPLGMGARALQSEDVPRYPEMFRSLCNQLGWDSEAFRIYRCCVDYPVISSSIVVGFDLPEKSAAAAD